MTATIAARTVSIVYSGALAGTQDLEAADNAATPAVVELKALAIGPNTITVPTGATACTIVPPVANATSITLKGLSGASEDATGIRLHNTDPTSIAIDASVVSFCLTVAVIVTVRLFWS